MTSSLSWKRSYQLSYAPDKRRDYTFGTVKRLKRSPGTKAPRAWGDAPLSYAPARAPKPDYEALPRV